MEGPNPAQLTRSPLPSATWSTFFNAVEKAMDLKLASSPPPGQKAPILVRDYPKTNLGKFDTSFDVILFRVLKSERAGTDPSGLVRKPKGPNLREVVPHPTKARYSLVTQAWWENMTVEFKVLAKSNDRADELVEWFHRFLMEYHNFLGFFKARGIQYMVYQSRGEDKLNNSFGQELNERTITYLIRLELLNTFEAKDLESLSYTVGTNPELEFDRVEQYQVPK